MFRGGMIKTFDACGNLTARLGAVRATLAQSWSARRDVILDTGNAPTRFLQQHLQ